MSSSATRPAPASTVEDPRLLPAEAGMHDLVGYAVRRAQLRVYEDLLATLAPWGITPPRFTALMAIAARPGLKATTLAAMLGVARSGAAVIIGSLVEKGYVERPTSDDDRRASALDLTATGRAALRDMAAAVREHDRRMTAAMSAEDRTRLIDLLGRVG